MVMEAYFEDRCTRDIASELNNKDYLINNNLYPKFEDSKNF